LILLVLLPSLIAAQQKNPYLDSLHQSLSSANNDTVRMNTYKHLGWYYILEDRDSSTLYLEKALPLAVSLNLKMEEAAIMNARGVLMMQQQRFSKSLECYIKAINIARDPAVEKTFWRLSPDQDATRARMSLLSDSYDLIGLLNAYAGNWIDNINNQLENYQEAEKYAIAAGDSGAIASINFHKGIAYMNAEKLDSALMYIKRAQSVFLDLDDSQLGRSMIYLGDTYKKMGNLDLAANSLF